MAFDRTHLFPGSLWKFGYNIYYEVVGNNKVDKLMPLPPDAIVMVVDLSENQQICLVLHKEKLINCFISPDADFNPVAVL